MMVKWQSANTTDTINNSTSNTSIEDLVPEKNTYDKKYERKSVS